MATRSSERPLAPRHAREPKSVLEPKPVPESTPAPAPEPASKPAPKPKAKMASSAKENLNLDKRLRVYVVMHHIETTTTPGPLNPPLMEANGFNATRTDYVYRNAGAAQSHANKLFMDRWYIRNGTDKDRFGTAGELHDFNDALLGYGFWFVIQKQATDDHPDATVKEWFWYEEQFLDLEH